MRTLQGITYRLEWEVWIAVRNRICKQVEAGSCVGLVLMDALIIFFLLCETARCYADNKAFDVE